MRRPALLLALSLLASPLFAQGGPRKAPELSFTIAGEGQHLLSQYRGKVIALSFVSTTCPHCQEEAHDMTKYQQEFGKRGFQAIDVAINVLDPPSTAAMAETLTSQFKLNFQVGFPVGWVTREQMMTFMQFSPLDRMVVPQLALIDRKGFIRYQTPATSGPAWDAIMKEPARRTHIEELLAEPATTSARPKSKMVAAGRHK